MFNLPTFFQLIDSLQSTNIPILVEGINDKKSLESFGLQNIILISKTPLYQIIETMQNSSPPISQICKQNITISKLLPKLFK